MQYEVKSAESAIRRLLRGLVVFFPDNIVPTNSYDEECEQDHHLRF